MTGFSLRAFLTWASEKKNRGGCCPAAQSIFFKAADVKKAENSAAMLSGGLGFQ